MKMNEIRGLRKDFTRYPNEPIVTWLLRCWDSGANSVWLDSREARQLGGIARDSAIDRCISTCQNQAFHPLEVDVVSHEKKTPLLKMISCLRKGNGLIWKKASVT